MKRVLTSQPVGRAHPLPGEAGAGGKESWVRQRIAIVRLCVFMLLVAALTATGTSAAYGATPAGSSGTASSPTPASALELPSSRLPSSGPTPSARTTPSAPPTAVPSPRRTSAPAAAATEQAQPPVPVAPGIAPPGANDPECELTDEHPNPVVLVHGTFADMTISWQSLSPMLREAGYCPWAFDFGNRGTGDIPTSAQQLADFVDTVLDTTDADEVDLVGHSQGGMMPRYYLKNLDGVDEVGRLIGLSSSNHGTTNPFAPGAIQCPACRQQAAGSAFITELNSGQETFDGVDYTVIQTRYDEVVTPFTSAFLNGPSERVTNILLQDKCPSNTVEHLRIPYDPDAIAWVMNALEQDGPADPAFNPCASSTPGGSGGSGGSGSGSGSGTDTAGAGTATAAGSSSDVGVAPAAAAVPGTPDFVG